MKTYLIERTDRYSYCDDYAAVVIAEDTLHAERFARLNISDFKKATLKVTEFDTENMKEETKLLVANVGA